MNYFSLLAVIAGVAIAAQASMNAQLGILLSNAILATSVAFASSLVFILIIIVVLANKFPSLHTIKLVPVYLWFAGGLLSAFAITSLYWLIPKMGVGQVMSFALSGQLLFAMMAGHFGWFQLPVMVISPVKLLGVACMLIGIVLINK